MVLSGEKSTSCQDTYHITWCDQVMESVVWGGVEWVGDRSLMVV